MTTSWIPPAFAPGVIWKDRPSSATPLDAENLNLEASSEATYAAMVGTSLANYLEGGSSPFIPTEVVLSPGNLGVAYTIDFASKPNVYVTLVATLNANATITFINRASGCRAVLLLVQDATGSRTLNVSDGSSSTSVSVQPAPATLTSLQVDCPNATDIYVSPLGSGGLPTSVVTQGTVAPGNLGAAYTIDFGAAGLDQLIVIGTLNANCTITFAHFTAGNSALLLLTQDGTGSRALTVSDGSNSALVSVGGAASTLSTVQVICQDSSTLDVSVLGASGPPDIDGGTP